MRCCLNSGEYSGQPFRLPGVTFFRISDTLIPTTYLVDTTLLDASDYDQTALAGRIQRAEKSIQSDGKASATKSISSSDVKNPGQRG